MISLREIQDSDVPRFWAHQSDPEARQAAAFTGKHHYDRAAFDAHWARIRADAGIVQRTILAGDAVVGHVAVFGPPDEREVTYWIDRAHWGRGIATTALRAFVDLVPDRPLYAHAAADNTGSIRVLEKCGFVVTGHDRGFALDRQAEIDEVALTLS